jgi:hypothetical protein
VATQNPFPIPASVRVPLRRYVDELNMYVQQWSHHVGECRKDTNLRDYVVIPNVRDVYISEARKGLLQRRSDRLKKQRLALLRMCTSGGGGGGDGGAACEAGDAGAVKLLETYARARSSRFFMHEHATGGGGAGGFGGGKASGVARLFKPLTTADVASWKCRAKGEGFAQPCKMRVMITHLDAAQTAQSPVRYSIDFRQLFAPNQFEAFDRQQVGTATVHT